MAVWRISSSSGALLRALCLALLLMAGLAGCGKIGPLYLPDDQPSKLSATSEYSLNLEKTGGSRKSAQAFALPGYMIKVLTTNKVTSYFFITLSKSIAYTSFSRPTDFSRLNQVRFKNYGSF